MLSRHRALGLMCTPQKGCYIYVGYVTYFFEPQRPYVLHYLNHGPSTTTITLFYLYVIVGSLPNKKE